MSSSNFNNRHSKLDKLLLILLLPGLIASGMLIINRLNIEKSSRAIDLTVDYSEVQSLSVSTGIDIISILEKFKSKGISSVAINEETIGSFVSTGQIQCRVIKDIMLPSTVMMISERKLADRVYSALKNRFPNGRVTAPRQSGGFFSVSISASPDTLMQIGVGLPADKALNVRSANLMIIGRVLNNPVITPKTIDAILEDIKFQGITHIICGSEEVLGFRGLIDYTADKILSEGFVYGSIEFAKQRGDASLCAKLKGNYIRVHSIPIAEMAGMAPSTAVERFARAVKERGIRLCYVRLPSTSGADPLGDNLAFIGSISDEIQKSGYTMGSAKPFDKFPRPQWAMILIGIAIVSGGVLLLNSLMSLSPIVKYLLLIAGSVIAAGAISYAEVGRQGMAFLSALIFPSLGVTAFAGQYFANRDENDKVLLKTIAIFLGATLFTLIGAAMIIGLLADQSYVVKLNQYSGIKISTMFPIMFVGFAICAGLPIFNKPYAQVKDEVCLNIRKLVAHPLFIWHAIAAIGALIVIALAVLRSGNDPGVGVSGLELKFRSILDKLLVVRPRTKEFMIGHPAFIAGTALLLKNNRGWGLPLLAFGVIGQTSLLNTFCHIHTPLSISVIRSFNGIWIGLLIGIILWLVIDKKSSVQPKMGNNN